MPLFIMDVALIVASAMLYLTAMSRATSNPNRIAITASALLAIAVVDDNIAAYHDIRSIVAQALITAITTYAIYLVVNRLIDQEHNRYQSFTRFAHWMRRLRLNNMMTAISKVRERHKFNSEDRLPPTSTLAWLPSNITQKELAETPDKALAKLRDAIDQYGPDTEIVGFMVRQKSLVPALTTDIIVLDEPAPSALIQTTDEHALPLMHDAVESAANGNEINEILAVGVRKAA